MTRELLTDVTHKLDLYYPPFLERMLHVLAACKERGALYAPIDGHRSFVAQAQIRKHNHKEPPAGYSGHNYGIAANLKLIDGADEHNALFLQEAHRQKLAAFWYPEHVALQWPGYELRTSMGKLKQVYDSAVRTHPLRTVARDADALRCVWRYLNVRL